MSKRRNRQENESGMGAGKLSMIGAKEFRIDVSSTELSGPQSGNDSDRRHSS